MSNRSDEAAGVAAPDTAGLRASAHSTQAAPLSAAQLRASAVIRAAGPPAADGQAARPAAGPALAHNAAPQAAQSPQVPGLASSTVPAHSSAAVADLNRRPAAAFERMDAAAPPRVLESSPQDLVVGVRDAGLGWVEIRTHAVGGQVAASLATGSHEAHAAIAAELPAVRNALMDQHVALHSLSAEQFPASSGGGGGSAGNPSNSARPGRQSSVKPAGEESPSLSEADGENLSYISVRV
ncbi:MAG TPA: hypothetical protein VHU89_19070 [Acidobacteriaceae bacterium]|nr:hypothetical protein [Acidobacteriaceae bacterium]